MNNQNRHLQLWLDGRLEQAHAFEPVRVVVTADATCNLACEHCYWPHNLSQDGEVDWGPAIDRLNQFLSIANGGDASLLVLYAGRILSKRGVRFLETLRQGIDINVPGAEGQGSTQGVNLSIIDNGYTVFAAMDFLYLYQDVNISIDGWREQHVRQRNKSGSFDVAWEAILKLKAMGYDPIVASALSPLNESEWYKFEELLSGNDVRVSTTFVWDLPATATRGTATIGTAQALEKIYKTLVDGVPKLINLYSLEHVKVLMPILKELEWTADLDSGDGLVADCNGSTILYRPTAPAFFREIELLWDGSLMTLEPCGRDPIDSVPDRRFKEMFSLAQKEREAWKDVSIKVKTAPQT